MALTLAELPSDVLKLVVSHVMRHKAGSCNLLDVLNFCSASKSLAALLSQLHEVRMTSIGMAQRTALRPKAGLGRILTTSFQPADYAVNSCGTNMCQAWQRAEGPYIATGSYPCSFAIAFL